MRSDVPSEAPKGVSEAFFLTHLQAHFPGWVDYGKVYQPSGWDEKYAYSADIELLLPCGLGIQIEIDEPYDGKTGSPHHCYDSGKDRQRDDFFLGGNWVIIRLSERQVVESPLACSTVAHFTPETTAELSFSSYSSRNTKKLWPKLNL